MEIQKKVNNKEQRSKKFTEKRFYFILIYARDTL